MFVCEPIFIVLDNGVLTVLDLCNRHLFRFQGCVMGMLVISKTCCSQGNGAVRWDSNANNVETWSVKCDAFIHNLHLHCNTVTGTLHIRGHKHTHTHTIIHTYIYTYVRMCVYKYIHTYTHTHVRTYIHTYTHTGMYVCVYINTYIHTYIHIHTRT